MIEALKGGSMHATVLWATDGSAIADVALNEALEVLAPGGRLVAFHADCRYGSGGSAGFPRLADEDDRREEIAERVEEVRARGFDIELVVTTTARSPAGEIIEAADEVGAQAIVCGTRGLGTLQRAFLGSVANQLLRHSHLPVLVTPTGVAAPAAVQPEERGATS
jgi:nucleotide-binding universal stress UspA family protein